MASPVWNNTCCWIIRKKMPINVRYVLAGHLRRDYILPLSGRPLQGVPGGSLLHAAVGVTTWEKGVGLLARVGEEYPQEWLKDFSGFGWDTGGIHILPRSIDQRSFHACLDAQTVSEINPLAHYARLGLPFPKPLLGYTPAVIRHEDWQVTPLDAPHPADIPGEYLDARAMHICPVDYNTAIRLTSAFREAGLSALTLDPSPAYMHRTTLESVRMLVLGLTAFLPSEEELRNLFWGRTNDIWEMAEAVASFGCEFVVVKRGAGGQLLYDHAARKRWEVPPYPARVADPGGAGSAFCGGFLAGYHRTFDLVRAGLHGNVSASICVEGSSALEPLECLPGLAERRLESLADMVRKV